MEVPEDHKATASVSDAAFELDLLDILVILAKWKRVIIGFTIGLPLFAYCVTLIMTPIYTGVTRIMPPQQSQSLAGSVLGQLGAVAGLATSSLGLKNPADLHVGMLKSRTVADRVIDRFNLKEYYKAKTLDKARRELADDSNITIGKDGLVIIEFDHPDPNVAAAIANAYVAELQGLMATLGIGEAAQRRLYFERELVKAKESLAKAEVALKQTMERSGIVKIEEQGIAIIEAISALRAQIAGKQIEIQSMRLYSAEANPDLARAREQLAAMKVQLSQLERVGVPGETSAVPASKIPEVGLDYFRHYRDVKYSEGLFEFLAKQLEASKLDESKDVLHVQVVDKAVPPEARSKPRTFVILVLTALAGIFLGLVTALLLEGLARAREHGKSLRQLEYIRSALRHW